MGIRIEEGWLEDGLHPAAARLIHLGFQDKARAFSNNTDAVVEVIQDSLAVERGFFAFDDGELVGVAGVDSATGTFLRFRFAALRRYLRPLQAATALLYLNFNRRVDPSETRLTTVAVDQDARGHGVGTALIGRVEGFARTRGYAAITLDVVDTNAAAHRLYERLGYEEVTTTRFGFLTRRQGFAASIHMRKHL